MVGIELPYKWTTGSHNGFQHTLENQTVALRAILVNVITNLAALRTRGLTQSFLSHNFSSAPLFCLTKGRNFVATCTITISHSGSAALVSALQGISQDLISCPHYSLSEMNIVCITFKFLDLSCACMWRDLIGVLMQPYTSSKFQDAFKSLAATYKMAQLAKTS